MYGVHVDVFTDHNNLQYMFTEKEFNLIYRRWLEFINNYDMSVHYNPSKANVVADALSKINMGSVTHVGNKGRSYLRMFTGLLAWEFTL